MKKKKNKNKAIELYQKLLLSLCVIIMLHLVSLYRYFEIESKKVVLIFSQCYSKFLHRYM